MRPFLQAFLQKLPVYLAGIVVLLTTVGSCWYALLAVQQRVPMSPWIYLGWLFLHFVTTALLVWAMWQQRAWFGLRFKAALIAYAVTAGWWCLPGPLYFLLTVNLDNLQLRWTNFGWMWELAVVGFVLLGGVAVFLLRPIRAYLERGQVPRDPGALYRYTLSYPRKMAFILVASAVLAFIVGNWQISQFSFLPLIEQIKIVVDGFVTALFAALFYYFYYDFLVSGARHRLEQEYELVGVPRRSFARRIFFITLVITVGSSCLLSVAVVQSTQILIHRTIRTELIRDLETVGKALTRLPAEDETGRGELLAMLKQSEGSQVFEGLEKFNESGLELTPATTEAVRTQANDIVEDSRGEHKIIGWLTPEGSSTKIIAVVFVSDFYGSLVQVLGLYSAIAFIVVVMTVLMTTVASKQLARALRRLTTEVQVAQSTEQPFTYDPVTADELEDLAHAFAYYSATVVDQTQALKEAIVHLQELDRVKSEFISTASHQLRTPLTGLKWCYDALLSGQYGTLPAEQQKIVKQGLAKTLFMVNLVNSLLDVARLEDNNVELQLDAVPLPELVTKIVSDLEPLSREKKITVEIKSPPSPLQPIRGDADKLTTAFTNLIDNAIKYTPAEGTVTIRLAGDAIGTRVSIADSGIGIPEDTMHRLFTKFFRAPNATAVHTSGSGLGLYITKNIIERHGGRIEVKSELERGSIFTVYLPVKGPAKT